MLSRHSKYKYPQLLLKSFSEAVSKSYGIYFDESSYLPLQEKIISRMTTLNITTPEEYLALIKSSKKEITNLVDSLTVNVTSFFRIPKHFQFLREIFLPEIKRQDKKQLKIWSAGCSNGAEAYSIAMEVFNFFGAHRHSWDIKIIASDISYSDLLFGKEGVYKNTFLKDIPEDFHYKYLSMGPTHFKVDDDLKKHITWDYHNLMYDNGYENFDIIFCRNVLYYFHHNAQEKVLQLFHKKLKNPGSPLLLGASEHLAVNFTDFFSTKRTEKGLYYYYKL